MKRIKIIIYSVLMFSITITYSQISKKSIAETYYNNAKTIFEQNGDLGNAMININKSIKLEPNNSNAYYIKGVIFQKKLEYSDALLNYKKALQLNSKNYDAMTKCGIVYGKLNDMTNCCKYFNMACENGREEACTILNKFCK